MVRLVMPDDTVVLFCTNRCYVDWWMAQHPERAQLLRRDAHHWLRGH